MDPSSKSFSRKGRRDERCMKREGISARNIFRGGLLFPGEVDHQDAEFVEDIERDDEQKHAQHIGGGKKGSSAGNDKEGVFTGFFQFGVIHEAHPGKEKHDHRQLEGDAEGYDEADAQA